MGGGNTRAEIGKDMGAEMGIEIGTEQVDRLYSASRCEARVMNSQYESS